jgi:PAS domain S-box-containing protein
MPVPLPAHGWAMVGLLWLHDARLKPLALSPLPAWLWSPGATQVLWANPTAAAMFGAPTPAALAVRSFDRAQTAAAEVARLAETLQPDGVARLERLRGFGAGIGRTLTCSCSRVTLADGSGAVLIAAIERSGPDLLLKQRVSRLLAAGVEPVAVFGDDGALIGATWPARRLIGDRMSLDSLGARALIAAASDNGRAAGDGAAGQMSIDRIRDPAVWIVAFANQAASTTARAATPAPVGEPGQPPLAPAAAEERRHPLRFVWQMDPDGRFTIDSAEFIAIAGPRTAALLGQPWQYIASVMNLDPDGQVAHAVATRSTWSGVSVLWRIDGIDERLGVELSGLPVFDRERTFRGYRGFGVCRDVARLNAIAQARRAAAASVAADDAPPITLAPADAPPAAEAPGLSPVERHAFYELSRQLTSRINEADAQALRAANVNAPAEPHDTQSDPCDDSHAVEPAAAPPGADQGVNAALDQLRAQMDELNAILDTATDGVIVLDRVACIVSSNRSAQALFGYDAHELEGRSFGDLFAPESIGTAIDYLDRLQGRGVAALLNDGREMIGRERLGGLIPLFVTMGRLGDAGDRYCAVFRDITQWKQVEEELIAARRDAERASSAKSDFLAKISHEIRTPLNAIIGFSEVMTEERFGPVGNERYRQYLKDIHASGGHLLSLINDLLDLSKIEAGKLELTFASVSLNDLTQQCVAIMQPQANRERIIIRTSLSRRLPQVLADARSVRQIVLNLLSNSIKFTVAGGQVIVSTAIADAGEVVLRVRDTGIGMSEKDLATALEPFRQVATMTRARAGGTGLGLPLTKALAEANHALFNIKSTPNEGTLVEITFPGAQLLAAQ